MNKARTGAPAFLATFDKAVTRRPVLAAMLAGAVAALAQAPLDLWPLGLAGFAVLFRVFTRAASLRRAALVGWAGGLGYFLLALFWIVEPFMIDPARHGWMAPFALVGMTGGLALFWGGAGAAAYWLGGRGAHFVLCFTLAELARAYVLTGFPWALIGYTLSPSPAVQLAAIVGPHGLTVLCLAAAVLLAQAARGETRRRSALAGLAACALLLPLGAWMQARPLPQTGTAPVVRLVQPNAPQDEKWDPARMAGFFSRQLAATAALPRPDLIVWPETSIPNPLHWADGDIAVMARAAAGVPVVFGAQRSAAGRWYNSLLVLDGEGALSDSYDKLHLVPFGEYVPFGDWLADYGIGGLAARDGDGFSPGGSRVLVDLPGIGAALPLICYEAVFPQDVNAAPSRPRLLLQITNDAWFGKISGPYQHLAQARMRAIEQGLPLIRAANTGVSAVIGPRGNVVAELALGQAGHIDAPLPPALRATPYSRTGDLPIALLLMVLTLAAVLRRRARRNGD